MMMNNIMFNGPFKDVIEQFIKYKRSQGYKYDAGIGALKRMNDYFNKNNCTKVELTEELVINFVKRKNENESNNTIYKRQQIIKEFALFLKDSGYKDVYVYNFDYIDSTVSNFKPYIFKDEEIKRMFNYIENNNLEEILGIKDKNFNKNFRMMLKIYYCCGLRRNECLNLQLKDVNVENGTIFIKDGKNYNSRLLPVSDTLLCDLKQHINDIGYISSDDYIFKKDSGKKYDKHFTDAFQKLLKILDIVTDEGKTPRLHDLRFTYAVKALEKMQREGQDIYCTLPILSVYMGHKNITSTEYYLKFTENARNIIADKTEDLNSYLYESTGDIDE